MSAGIDPESLVAGSRQPRPVIVDVRDAQEYAEAHIPGAIHIALAELEARRNELPRNTPVVTYCNLRHPGNARCEQAAELLQRQGIQAQILAGGFTGWRAAGRPVESGAQPGCK